MFGIIAIKASEIFSFPFLFFLVGRKRWGERKRASELLTWKIEGQKVEISKSIGTQRASWLDCSHGDTINHSENHLNVFKQSKRVSFFF